MNAYVGVEERTHPDGRCQTGLRFSSDLVSWSPLHVLDEAAGGWGHSKYTYPRLVDAQCTTNHAVNRAGFYLSGLRPADGDDSRLYLMHLRINRIP